jgi:hypothetical protein
LISSCQRAKKIRKYGAALLLIGALSITTSFSGSATAKMTAPRSQQGWVISQSSNFAGTVFSELTPTALRMKVGRLGLILITRAPDWKAYVYNENTRNYVEMPYHEWQQKLIFSQTDKLNNEFGRYKLTAKTTGKTTRISGLRAYECLVERKGDSKLGVPTEKITDLWIASDINAPPQVAQIFCSRLNIPTQKGIPLRATHRNNGRMVSVLDTLDVHRKTLPPSNFEPLKNYKRVKDEMGLMMDESTEDIVNDLLDTSSPGAPLKTPGKN